MKRSDIVGLGLVAVVAAAACWAMSGVFINYISDGSDISAFGLAFWRELFTTILLFAGIRLSRPELLHVKRQDWIWLALMGGLGMGLLHVAWNLSVIINGPAVATILQYNSPILVSLIAFLLWREPFSGRKLMAIGLALIGTILVARIDWQVGAQMTTQGFMMGMGTAVSFSAISLFAKKLSGEYHTWTILFYTFSFATIALLPFQIGRPLPQLVSPPALLSFIGLLLVSTIGGYALYTIGLRRLPASVAVIIATLEVPFSAIAAYLFLGHRLNIWQGLGAVCVVSGVILLSIPMRTAKRSPEVVI